MSYGHADKLARSAASPPDEPGKPPPVAPEVYQRPDLRPALTTHDVGALYRALTEAGLSQHRIATLTGQRQSDVCEIIKGRRVVAYDVLARLAAGLGIPPERIGLSWWGPDGAWYGPERAYPGDVTVTSTPEGVSADMLRRHLLALGGVSMVGAPVAKLGELLATLDGLAPAPVPLPCQLSGVQVAQMRT